MLLANQEYKPSNYSRTSLYFPYEVVPGKHPALSSCCSSIAIQERVTFLPYSIMIYLGDSSLVAVKKTRQQTNRKNPKPLILPIQLILLEK